MFLTALLVSSIHTPGTLCELLYLCTRPAFGTGWDSCATHQIQVQPHLTCVSAFTDLSGAFFNDLPPISAHPLLSPPIKCAQAHRSLHVSGGVPRAIAEPIRTPPPLWTIRDSHRCVARHEVQSTETSSQTSFRHYVRCPVKSLSGALRVLYRHLI